MLVWIEALVDGIGDWVGFILITPFALLGAAVKGLWTRSKNNEDRIESIEETLSGDDDDPNNPGALQLIYNVDQKVECLDQKIDENRNERKQEHSEVAHKLESLEEKIDGDE